MPSQHKSKNSSTIDQNEIKNFSKDSSKWWDENGPFKPLHQLNPVRMEYIEEQISKHYPDKKISELNVLDIGCGGGLVSEAIAEFGANITGIDADENAINVAKTHAKKSNLNITYIHGDAENMNDKYDVVIALEIIEHVSDINAFIKICSERLNDGGLLIMSTLNRTAKSYVLGIVAAEYILRWVPRGTHTWSKFVKPSEIVRNASKYNLAPNNITGLIYNPLNSEYLLSETDLDVNYLISLRSDT